MRVIDEIKNVRKHLQGVKAVLFDLDDTLYGEKEYVRSGYKAIANFLPQVQNAEEKLLAAFEKKQPAIDTLLRNEGIYTEQLRAACVETYRTHVPTIEFYSEAEKLLVDLRKEGYGLGIITDGRPEGQRAKIKALTLEKYVDYIIITDELGGVEYRKPNPKAFMLMKEYFGVEFCALCYVGDNLRKDFIAPERLGMRTIYFKNADGLYYEGELR